MGFYRPPSITTIREDTQTSVVLTGGEVIPALIGKSNGKTTQIKGYLASMGATDLYNLPDLRPAGPATSVQAVRSSLQGGIEYAPVVDFAFDVGLQRITFQDVALQAPYIVSIDDVVAASSLLSNSTTYYYVVSAIKPLDLTGPVTGETAASNVLSAKPIAATSRLKLNWRPVAGATGYRIYRSVVSGNFTGSTLIATISNGFVTSYEDAGGAASAGSPHGVPVFARVVAGIDTPNSIPTGSVMTFAVDTVDNVVTLSGTRPAITGVGITYPVTVVLGTNDTLNLKVTDGTGTYTTSVVLPAGAGQTAANIATSINGFPFLNGSADVSGGQIRLRPDASGSIAKVEVLGGSSLTLLGLSVSSATGTGVLPDFTHVTTAQLASATSLQLTGATASVDPTTGRLAITNNVGGSAHSLQPRANANTLLSFSTSLVAGNDATPGTALRRPAFHGDSFYVDYSYVGYANFVAQRFTNLTRLIAEYGLGSNLAIAGSLAMGSSGRGNGASQVVTMPVPDDTLVAFQTALDLLKRRRDVTLVVPLTVVDGINLSTLDHCIESSNDNNQRERRGYLGTPKGTIIGDEDTANSAVYYARQLNHERATLVHPWPFVAVQAADGTVAETELDGWASAACVAGKIANLSDRATSPTAQRVFGISRLGAELDATEENILGGAGVCVLTLEDGNVVIRDGITTSLEDQTQSRIQIGLVDDLLRQTFRTQFKGFRGRKLLPTLLKLVVRRTLRILTLFKKLQLIADFNPSSVSASQDADVLTTVDANFSYRPMFDVRDIDFRYFLDLTTGSIA